MTITRPAIFPTKTVTNSLSPVSRFSGDRIVTDDNSLVAVEMGDPEKSPLKVTIEKKSNQISLDAGAPARVKLSRLVQNL